MSKISIAIYVHFMLKVSSVPIENVQAMADTTSELTEAIAGRSGYTFLKTDKYFRVSRIDCHYSRDQSRRVVFTPSRWCDRYR